MIGRPEKSEAPTAAQIYIDQVRGEDPVHAVQIQLEPSLALFQTVSEERSVDRYASDKWNIRQVLNHVADTERAFAFRALWFARGFESPLPGYDQNVAASGAEASLITWAAHVEDFRRVRLATLSLFDNMPASAWMRSGIADGNRVTVRALAFMIAGHLTHHLAILRERYL